MKTLSLRARLTLWYTIALVLVLGLFGGNVLIEQKRLGIRRADQELDTLNDIGRLRERFIDAGVFIRPFGSAVYLTPAFTIAEDDLAALTRAVFAMLSDRSP